MQLCSSLSILWHCLSLGLEWKLTFFQSFGHCWVFQICWHIECSTFTESSFRMWSNSTGILSPPLPSEEGNGTPLQHSCLENLMDGGAWWATVHGVAKSRTRLSDFTFTFHFHALEKEMATHSSVLAWRIPGLGEPGGLPSMGSHRVGHDWSDLAAAAAALSQVTQGLNPSVLHSLPSEPPGILDKYTLMELRYM